MNFFHRVKQLMPHFIWKFWNICVNVCDVYDLNCGQKGLDSASRQCTLTLGTYCAWVFRQKWHDYHGSPFHSPDLAPCDFFFVPWSENDYAGWTFWGCREHQMWNDEASEEPNFAEHATLFSTMEKVLDQVHSLGGRVLWGWPRAHSGIIEIRFLVSSVHKHFVHTA
jgi:hypothetical protein